MPVEFPAVEPDVEATTMNVENVVWCTKGPIEVELLQKNLLLVHSSGWLWGDPCMARGRTC